MDSDPRVSKPRLPKPYTEEQLSFLRSHIGGFETRTRGHVRGDAKKFALDRANDFLLRFGLPPDLQGAEEAEPRFREVSRGFDKLLLRTAALLHIIRVDVDAILANIQLV
jgi:hypothetical protein